MKILMVIPYLAPSYGGTSKVVKELAESLGKRSRFHIDIVATHADNGNVLSVNLNQWIQHSSYRVKYFSTWHRSDLILSPSLIQWLIRNLKEYDLVHTHTIFSPIISFTHGLCRFFGIPYIMTPHGMLEPWALSYKATKKAIYYAQIERESLRRASVIQAIASTESNNIDKLGFHNSVLVPNGLHKEEYLSLPKAEIFYQKFPETMNKRIILFLGRIDPKKGLDLLAPAFSRILSVFSDAHLVVAGPDSINFISTAKIYFAQSNCLKAVTFTGMLSGDLKYAALSAANLYVCPSYSEGFSMSILEGMACGLPCIITENCNFPEAQLANAAYVVPTNAQAIGDALLYCLHHPSDAQSVGQTARQFIFQNYTWEQSAQKLIKTYNEILQRAKGNESRALRKTA